MDGAETPRDELQLRMSAPDPTSASIPAASTFGQDRPTINTRASSFAAPNGSLQSTLLTSPQESGDVFEADEAVESRSYGLPAIREILRVLISLLNPHDQQHTDSMRLMSLGLLNVAFDIGGRSIGRFGSLRAIVADDLCKYLFQLARSENPVLLSTAMRVVSNVFDTMRSHLKLQQELFISFLVDRLIRPPPNVASANLRKGEMESELDASTWNIDQSSMSTIGGTPKNPQMLATANERRSSGSLGQSVGPSAQTRYQPLPVSESRDLMLEYIVQFARAPDFMTNLWINYDCNVDCEDLFERLIKFFSRGVYPAQSNGPYLQDNSQLLCLDTLLTFVNHLSTRLDVHSQASEISDNASALAAAKASKRTLLEGIVRFNEKPKDGIAFLDSKGLIYTDDNKHLPKHEILARFLKTCPRLDKKLLGDYISRPDNIQILRAFIELFDFRGKIISEALRDLLEAFRLPGESQQIDRITETFSQVYVDANPGGEIRSADAAYVISFSIIMLNTDLHSPQIRKRMTLEDYGRNLKGVNDKEDFSPEYIKGIYENIRRHEIIMPEEHVGQLGFEFAWKELLRRARTAGPFVTCQTDEFDRAMFALAWKPVISAVSYAFTHFMDDYMLQRAISGFQQCAALANPNLPEVFDHTIRSLSKITGLSASTIPPDASTNFPTVDIDGQTVTISPLALRFGTSFKSQLAAVVLFNIANEHAALVSTSWIDIFEIYQSLFTYSLLPQSLVNMEEFLAGAPAIPLKVRVQPAAPEEKRRNDGGLLSTLSSYLLSPYAQGPDGIGRDVTDDDIEHALSTLDCVASCKLDVLYKTIIALPSEAVGMAVRGLVDLNERLTLDRVRQRSSISLQSNGPPSPASGRVQVPYDPSVIFMLEFMMSIAGEAEHAITETWPVIFEFVQKLLASASSFHHILLERSVTGLLRLASCAARQDAMRDQVFLALDALRTLPQGMLSIVSDQIAAGLSRIMVENPTAIRSATEWNLVFALWSATAQREEAASTTFGLVAQLASGQIAGGLGADNFVGFIGVLNDFANVASQGDVRYRNSHAGQADPVVARGRQALEMVREAQSLANELIQKSTLPPNRAWEHYWLPVLSAYSQQSVNGCREIRQTALANLQRTLVANEILSNADIDLIMVFERLIFPMLDELLKPQVFRRDPEGMGETRLRASALLCKIFLHYLVQLSQKQGMSGMTDLWMKILGYLDRFMHSGRRDQMYEAVPESLKNVLLVMHASGFLVPPHQSRSEEQSALWDATFDRLDIFLPQLRQDLFPAPVAQRASQLALQPQLNRSPSLSPALKPIRDGPDSEVTQTNTDSPSQSLSVYL